VQKNTNISLFPDPLKKKNWPGLSCDHISVIWCQINLKDEHVILKMFNPPPVFSNSINRLPTTMLNLGAAIRPSQIKKKNVFALRPYKPFLCIQFMLTGPNLVPILASKFWKESLLYYFYIHHWALGRRSEHVVYASYCVFLASNAQNTDPHSEKLENTAPLPNEICNFWH
jgi:hypothetical protein